MGQFFPNSDQFPLEDQIKNLGDDELLDFWEETQYLERMLTEEENPEVDHSVEYRTGDPPGTSAALLPPHPRPQRVIPLLRRLPASGRGLPHPDPPRGNPLPLYSVSPSRPGRQVDG